MKDTNKRCCLYIYGLGYASGQTLSKDPVYLDYNELRFQALRIFLRDFSFCIENRRNDTVYITNCQISHESQLTELLKTLDAIAQAYKHTEERTAAE